MQAFCHRPVNLPDIRPTPDYKKCCRCNAAPLDSSRLLCVYVCVHVCVDVCVQSDKDGLQLPLGTWMRLMSLIKSTSVITLLFLPPPGHLSQFLYVVSSPQILSKDGGPPASSDCFGKRETGCSSELFTFDKGFSFSFKGGCTVWNKLWESQGKKKKTLFHHTLHLFNTHVHPLKGIFMSNPVHTCTACARSWCVMIR